MTHSHIPQKLRRAWRDMFNRCYGTSEKYIHQYQKRGITIDPKWLTDRSSFFEWAQANGWEEGMILHRIDNDGNYGPDNCEFLTKEEHAAHHHKPIGYATKALRFDAAEYNEFRDRLMKNQGLHPVEFFRVAIKSYLKKHQD